MDGPTPNPKLSDPIAWALRILGGSPTDDTNPVDADMATITAVDAFLDLAELRTMEAILGNLALVDVRTGPVDEKLSQLSTILASAIKDKRDVITAMHNSVLTIPLSGSDKRAAVMRTL